MPVQIPVYNADGSPMLNPDGTPMMSGGVDNGPGSDGYVPPPPYPGTTPPPPYPGTTPAPGGAAPDACASAAPEDPIDACFKSCNDMAKEKNLHCKALICRFKEYMKSQGCSGTTCKTRSKQKTCKRRKVASKCPKKKRKCY